MSGEAFSHYSLFPTPYSLSVLGRNAAVAVTRFTVTSTVVVILLVSAAWEAAAPYVNEAPDWVEGLRGIEKLGVRS